MALIVSMLLAALCMALLYRKRSDFPFRLLYGALSIFVTIIFLPLNLVPRSVLPILAASSYFCFSLVSMNMVITTEEMSQLRRIYPSIVFGFSAAFVYTLTDAGPLIVSSLGQLLGLSQIIVASMMVVYLISIAGLLFGFSGSERALGGTGDILEDAKLPSKDLSDAFLRFVAVQKDLIPACCAALAERYKLTAREKEVLELMARGRDLTHIAEMMYVSHNTVRSHCRNLYRKLDVHSKQEALDMLEEMRKEVLESD